MRIRDGKIFKLISLMVLILLAFVSSSSEYFVFVEAQQKALPSSQPESPTALSKASPPPASPKGKVPTIINNTSNLKVELVFKGIRYPSNMVLLGPNDILVLEKNNGTVKRIANGTMLEEPLFDVNVATKDERGMLGIAVSKHDGSTRPTYVFLYFTESKSKDGDDLQGKNPLGNRLYRYELENNRLIKGKLLLDLPAIPGPHHNGGNVLIGPDNNLYVVIGDVETHRTQSQNIAEGPIADGTSAIYRITQDGKPPLDHRDNNTLVNRHLNKFYAYGVRNSFGMDFDPVTAKLWDTENGPGFGDEINLVEPGFNSGWIKVQGIWKPQTYFGGQVASVSTDRLVDFNGTGKYSPPEFIWNQTIGVTALKFLNSDKLGKQYKDDMFVGDINNGNIYHFDLNKNRTEILLNGSLADKIANTKEESDKVIFANGFAGITDIEVGSDGYLYVLTFHKSQGSIYRIVPATTKAE